MPFKIVCGALARSLPVCYVIHIVGRWGWGICSLNAIEKAHAQVRVGRDRQTHRHVFLNHLPKYFASIFLMESVLNTVISALGSWYNKSSCLSPLESSLLLLL